MLPLFLTKVTISNQAGPINLTSALCKVFESIFKDGITEVFCDQLPSSH